MKLKTHSGASKRFKITGNGKVVRRQSGKRHLLSHKSSRRKRNITGGVLVHSGEVTMVHRLLPH